MVEVAHHGRAAPQLRRSPVPVVVVGERAVVYHGRDVREDALRGGARLRVSFCSRPTTTAWPYRLPVNPGTPPGSRATTALRTPNSFTPQESASTRQQHDPTPSLSLPGAQPQLPGTQDGGQPVSMQSLTQGFLEIGGGISSTVSQGETQQLGNG